MSAADAAISAIGKALTPGSFFNQQGKIFRHAHTLAQFAGVSQGEVLELLEAHLDDRVTIRPSAKHPEKGPLIALTEFLPDQEEVVQVQIVGGNAFAGQDPDDAVADDEAGEGPVQGLSAALAKIGIDLGANGDDAELVAETGEALAEGTAPLGVLGVEGALAMIEGAVDPGE
jgi:hypothetical protein